MTLPASSKIRIVGVNCTSSDAAERLLGHRAAVEPLHFPVAPQVERDRDEMPSRLVDDRALREVRDHQLRAVRAAVLAEVDEQALAVARGIVEVLAKVEERGREPRRDVDRVRRRLLRSTAGDLRRRAMRDAEHRRATIHAHSLGCGSTIAMSSCVSAHSRYPTLRHTLASHGCCSRGSPGGR